jgi:glycerol-3-phosphate acyltransferase PlsX
MRIAIDAMGGDAGPSVIVDGALVAARHLQVGLLLVGDAAAIEGELARHPVASLFRRIDVQIIDAPDRVEMSESPAVALPKKPRASIRVAADAVREGRADALFSAGHTGASVMAAHAAFGLLPGVDRPALATIIPTRRAPAVLLDAGATVGCRPPHLVQFAVMGSAYARVALGLAPRVGLLSVGEERGGHRTDARRTSSWDAPVNFIGNVEGRDVYAGEADVIVCDGFTGNVTLKVSEGLVETIEALLHDELAATFGGRVGYVLSRQAFRRFRRRVDYSEYGGAPLVGLNGLCIVGHGRSSAKAVANAVTMCVRAVNEDLLGRLSRDVARIAALPMTPPVPDPRSPTSGIHSR